MPKTYRFQRGGRPTPPEIIAAAQRHVHDGTPLPTSCLLWAKHLNPWGNIGKGDCCTAEECFKLGAAAPGVFVPQRYAIKWAQRNGFAQGATPYAVMSAMATEGMVVSGVTYKDGPPSWVDWTSSTTLASAIATSGPIKLGVASGNLEEFIQEASVSGYCVYGYPAGLPQDHCISLCGYASTLDEMVSLFAAKGVTVTPPSGTPTGLTYAFFTWGGVDLMDLQSLLNMTGEAWVRTPPTIEG